MHTAITATSDRVAGLIAVAAGGVLLYKRLEILFRTVSRPVADAYSDGWDSGYEKGWRDADSRPRMQLVTREGDRRRVVGRETT